MAELAPCLPLPQSWNSDSAKSLPRPASLVLTGTGHSDRVIRAVARLNRHLQPLSGGPTAAGQNLPLQLEVRNVTAPVPQFGDSEGYQLSVAAVGVLVRAEREWGALHALETLQQLLGSQDHVACCEVSDEPRFSWRGLLLDVARHYLSLETLQRTLDCMAAVKLNVLHLHLTDDQGFRFRSRAYPKLASAQAYDAGALRDLVAFAADRGIRIVPELDMPGHVTSWLLAYPEWGTEPVAATQRFGVHPAALNPADDKLYQVIDTLLEELIEVFPDHYLHLGGDEVQGQWWQRSTMVQSYMRVHGLTDNAALQAHFNLRVRELLAQRGRRMVLWDEALHADLVPKPSQLPVVIQNWRGATTRDRALAVGHCCIVSSGYYLDLHYPADWHYLFDPAAPQPELLAHEDALLARPDFERIADGIRWTHQWRRHALNAPPPTAAPLLGGEACLWGELVDDATLDVRLWYRLPAIAERFWSAATHRDCESMYQRQASLLKDWARSGRNDLAARTRAGLLAAGVDDHWQGLLLWFEPIKWYGRLLGEAALGARLRGTEMPQARPYQTATPLAQPIDHIPVECLASRDLQRAVERGDMPTVQQAAEQWQSLLAANDCPPGLQPQRAALQHLLQLVRTRLTGTVLSAEERVLLQQLKAPQADLLLAPAYALEPWLSAAS